MRLIDLYLELRIGKNRFELETFVHSDRRLIKGVDSQYNPVTAVRKNYVFTPEIGCTASAPVTYIRDIQKFYAWAEGTGYWPAEELEKLMPYVVNDLLRT